MPINFETTPFKINSSTIIVLPKSASAQLPSRGMVMVKGSVNGTPFHDALEPDGRGSHWFKTSAAKPGQTISVTLESTKDWPEPTVPADLQAALKADPDARAIWQDVTPMARWDWIRWMGATKSADTRRHHIEVLRSKLKNGTRRPCCFNRSMCTDPSVSKSGVLLAPAQATV